MGVRPGSRNRDRTLVMIPARAEGDALADVIVELLRDERFDVLLLDGGHLESILPRSSRLHRIEVGQGVGAATLAGLSHAEGLGYRFIAKIDADGQHDPASLAREIEVDLGGADFVVGSRFQTGSSFVGEPPPDRVLINVAVRHLVEVITGKFFPDVLSGFWIMRPPVAAFLARNLTTKGYGVTLEALIVLILATDFTVGDFTHDAIYEGKGLASKYGTAGLETRLDRSVTYFRVLTECVERFSLSRSLLSILVADPATVVPR